MEINWINGPCFKLTTSEAILFTDPSFVPPDQLANSSSITAVTFNIPTENRSDYEGLPGNPKIIQGPGEYEISSIYIRGIAIADKSPDDVKQINTIYLIQTEGLSICHLGHLTTIPSNRDIQELSSIDVLFIPIDGNDTITPQEAAEITNSFAPSMVIPMAYQKNVDNTNFQDALVSFSKYIGVKEFDRRTKLTLNKSTDTSQTQLIVLEPLQS
jgi:L-ascorbate metabolism protein UlaG (beta-lactamase superfamily)